MTITPDLLRVLVIFDVALIVVCLSLIEHTHRKMTPKPVIVVALIKTFVITLIAVATAANLVAVIEFTPGLVTLSVCLTPVALLSMGLVPLYLRIRR